MKTNNKGFSLVEILIALAVSSIILIALGTLLTQTARNYRVSTIKSKLETKLDNSFSIVEDVILNANSVTITDDNNRTVLKTTDISGEEIDIEYDKNKKELSYLSSGESSYISGNITGAEFKININAAKISTGDNGVYKLESISEFLMLDIKLAMEINGQKREIIRTFTTRNSCDKKISIGLANANGALEYTELINNEDSKVTLTTNQVEKFFSR